MKSYQSRMVKETVCRLTIILLLLVVTAGAALAQGPPAGAGAPGIINPKGDTDARTNREASLRSAEMPSSADQANQRRLAAAIDQTKQDFKRIQLVRNDMVDELLANKPLDFKRITEQTTEVNKRANRLRTFLVPAKPEEKKKEAENSAEMNNDEVKGALIKLCNLIHSFTTNPMFKEIGDKLDLKEADKANSDLLAIIEISEKVRINAERLSKTSK